MPLKRTKRLSASSDGYETHQPQTANISTASVGSGAALTDAISRMMSLFAGVFSPATFTRTWLAVKENPTGDRELNGSTDTPVILGDAKFVKSKIS